LKLEWLAVEVPEQQAEHCLLHLSFGFVFACLSSSSSLSLSSSCLSSLSETPVLHLHHSAQPPSFFASSKFLLLLSLSERWCIHSSKFYCIHTASVATSCVSSPNSSRGSYERPTLIKGPSLAELEIYTAEFENEGKRSKKKGKLPLVGSAVADIDDIDSFAIIALADSGSTALAA
jgi:hypothetical protein